MSFIIEASGGSISTDDRAKLIQELSALLREKGILSETQTPKGTAIVELVVIGTAHAIISAAVNHAVRAVLPYFKELPNLLLKFRRGDDVAELKGSDVSKESIDRIVSRIQKAVGAKHSVERRYALLIANSQFRESSALNGLMFPEVDAAKIKAVLQDPDICEFSPGDVQVLMDAPRVDVEHAASQLLEKAGVNDLCLLYYSGHGVHDASGAYYLATSDTSETVQSTAFSTETLRRFLRNSKCRTKIVVLDACHAASSTSDLDKRATSYPPPIPSLESGTGTIFLQAAGKTRPAKESPTHGMSVYSHYLVEGLQTGEADANTDGVITLDELHNFVATRVLEEIGEKPEKRDSEHQGPPIVIGRNKRRITEKKLGDLREQLIRLSSGVLDSSTYEEWRDFLKSFDSLEKDPERLHRLDVLLELLAEDIKPAKVIRAWDALSAQAAPSPAPSWAQLSGLVVAAEREPLKNLIELVRQGTKPSQILSRLQERQTRGRRATLVIATTLTVVSLMMGLGIGSLVVSMTHQKSTAIYAADKDHEIEVIGRKLRVVETELATARGDSAREKSARERADASRERLAQEIKAVTGTARVKIEAIEFEKRNVEASRSRLERDFKAAAETAKNKIDALELERRNALAAADAARTGISVSAEMDCDLLASDDYDPDRSTTRLTGASLDELRGADNSALRARAIASCRSAFEKSRVERHRYQLARMLLAADDKAGGALLIESANQGYSAAMALLGLAYREGPPDVPTVSRDLHQSRSWFDKAIAKGNPTAMVQRALMLIKPDFAEQDLQKAEQLLLRAAQSEPVGTVLPSARVAYVMLGHLYGGNPGWKKHALQTDCKKTKDFYRKAVAGNKDPAFGFKHLAQWSDKPPC